VIQPGGSDPHIVRQQDVTPDKRELDASKPKEESSMQNINA
jgi:hypothetical protein